MKRLKKILGLSIALVVLVFAGAFAYLIIAPPALLQVGAAYSSKIVCSSTFLSGRDPSEVVDIDVQAPGNPLLKGFFVNTDRSAGVVRSGFLRFIAPMGAVARPGLGCSTVHNGDPEQALAVSAPPLLQPSTSAELWPAGARVEPDANPDLTAILNDDALAGEGMRAIVVVKDGNIVGERYGAGFDAQTRLLGWSMAKTVTGALIGTLVDRGQLALDQDHLLPEWSDDGRAQITVRHLLSMTSGLHFNEEYGDVSDVNRMLFLEPDMAAFAASFPLDHTPGETFSYSSGSTVLLSKIWQNTFDNAQAALAWPRDALFGPIGMNTAVMEADATGTFVGGSYLYATPRDWARFGLLLMNGGRWGAQQIVSRDYVDYMVSPVKANPAYGQGHVWRAGREDSDLEGDNLSYGIPEDAFWMRGHDGQTVTIIPSAGLVVVRMGLTPAKLGYRAQNLVGAIVSAIGKE